jgi:AAA+ ATPase superfamily predicted ATPase
MLRGRRRVGKSRLVEVFCERAGVPFVFFQASQGSGAAAERSAFAEAVRYSEIPGRELFAEGTVFSTWSALFRQLAQALPDDQPSIVVIDELPWLLESDPELEGVLQTSWDRALSRKPVLLVLIGSDLAMMERLDDYQRPFHQRATVMVLPPLNPAEVRDLLGCGAADAMDAYLVTGGLPLICQEWSPGSDLRDFLRASVTDPTSALLVSGERSLAAEFPAELQARSVLATIGNGERTWKGIQDDLSARSGKQVPDGTLSNALRLLGAKRVISIDEPLSARPASRDRRYRVVDPYLRFYLAFLRQGLSLVERGRGDLVMLAIERSWKSWRGKAVEPVIREAMLRLAPDLGFPGAEAVGGWWNRQNNPEIDLIGLGAPRTVLFAGSVKWHEARPFGYREYQRLVGDIAMVPGADEQTRLLAISRTGTAEDRVPIRCLGPEDLLNAWRVPGTAKETAS